MTAAVYTTETVAGLLDVSTWTLYEAVRRGDPPVPPIRVGRRIVWSKSAVDQLLGLTNDEGRDTTPGPSHNTTMTPNVATTRKDKRDANC